MEGFFSLWTSCNLWTIYKCGMDQLKRRRSLEMDLRRRPSVASAGDLRKVTRSIFKRLDLSEEVRLEVSCSHSKQSSITSSIAFRLWRETLSETWEYTIKAHSWEKIRAVESYWLAPSLPFPSWSLLGRQKFEKQTPVLGSGWSFRKNLLFCLTLYS